MLNPKSLRTRILIPLLAAAALTSVVVAWTSWSLGHRWATDEVWDRYQSIRLTLRETSFPMSKPVVKSLSTLTGTEWIALDDQSRIVASTLPVSIDAGQNDDRSTERFQLEDSAPSDRHGWTNAAEQLTIDGQTYYALAIDRQGAAPRDEVRKVVVLFDRTQIDQEARRAALFPLLTGLSTIALISILMYFISTRLIARLKHLESQVQRVAEGDFETRLSDQAKDEVGRLAATINSMANQLRALWAQAEQEQGAKLLHQMAAGMAHQLRNTLTGARMAIELHQGTCPASDSDEVGIAIRQLEIAEDYVNRLLTVGAPETQPDRPQSVAGCLADVRSTHQPIASHLKVKLDWNIESELSERIVKDGASFSAAISNLILNAMHAGTHISVDTTTADSDCIVLVSDNGPGVEDQMTDNLFEPFVTSKPEGMGLGLPLVRRTAKYLDGSVNWRRVSDRTVFEFRCHTDKENIE